LTVGGGLRALTSSRDGILRDNPKVLNQGESSKNTSSNAADSVTVEIRGQVAILFLNERNIDA
jgi:hypothetical protein